MRLQGNMYNCVSKLFLASGVGGGSYFRTRGFRMGSKTLCHGSIGTQTREESKKLELVNIRLCQVG